MSAEYSQNVLGQPWVRTIGNGRGPFPRSCTAWTCSPSTVTRTWWNSFRLRAQACTSNSLQAATTSRSACTSVPASSGIPSSGEGHRASRRRRRNSAADSSSNSTLNSSGDVAVTVTVTVTVSASLTSG